MAKKVYTATTHPKKSIQKHGSKIRYGILKTSKAATSKAAGSKVAPVPRKSANLLPEDVEKRASRQVLVIPSPSFLSAISTSEPEVMMIEARRATGSGGGRSAVHRPTAMKQLLEERRRGLEKLANLGFSSSRGLAWAESRIAGRHQGRVRGRGSTTRKRGEYPGIEILEGVGALIVDREVVDVAAMAGASGSTIVENEFIASEDPAAAKKAVGGLAPDVAWHLQNIDIGAARQAGLDGKGTLIGILDSGIDATHEEFIGKTVHFAQFDVDGKFLTSTPTDVFGHGTHVGALAAGRSVGVAPAASLAVAAVLTVRWPDGRRGGYLAQILKGINWLLSESFNGAQGEPGVDLINASLVRTGYTDKYYSTLATARLTTGTVMIAAIGNSGPNENRHGSPGNYDIVIGVGAIDEKNRVAPFSDWGTVAAHKGLGKPDLCAPGMAIWSARAGGGYIAQDGTSMASPIVAGTVALLLQKDQSLRMNAPALVNKLYEYIVPLPGADVRGGPRGRLLLTGI